MSKINSVRLKSKESFQSLLFEDSFFDLLRVLKFFKSFVPDLLKPLCYILAGWIYQLYRNTKKLPVSNSRKYFTKVKNYYAAEVVSPEINWNIIKYPVSKDFTIPEINLYTIEDVFIVMGMSIITYRSKYYYVEEDDLKIHVIPDESLGINLHSFLQPHKINILSQHKEVLKFSEAMVISCSLASNYCHWLSDYLPRIILFYRDKKNLSVPLILSTSLHKNIISSIHSYNSKIFIHRVRNFSGLKIKKLFYISPVSYVPYNFRSRKISNKYKSQIGFSRKFFKDFKDYYPTISLNKTFENVYLLRKSKVRKILNEDQVIKALKKLGFLIIDPTKLSFLDQAIMFHSAKIIVSSAGATFANIVFSNEKQVVVSLLSDNPDHGFSFFPNLSYVSSRCRIHFFFGTKTKHSIHEDFFINADLLANEIRMLSNFSSSKTV